MFNIGIIGVGNAGGQNAALAAERLGVDALCLNSSQKDLDTLGNNVTKILIGDSKGAGKNRDEAKLFVKNSLRSMIADDRVKKFFVGGENGEAKDFVFVISSTGGGTGSGAAPLLTEILKSIYTDVNFIIIGILPSINEAMSAQVNTLEYFKELYETSSGVPYMVYDNEKMCDKAVNVMMEGINAAIVDDIDILRGSHQISTKYSAIDEKDMTSILTTAGRIVIAGAKNIKEKMLDKTSIDELIIEDFKSNAHAETNRDKVVHRLGIISVLDNRCSEKFDGQVQAVQEFVGTPVETFQHFAIKDDNNSGLPNDVIVIASGLSKLDDRIDRIKERIDEINAAMDAAKSRTGGLDDIDIDALNSRKHAGDNKPARNPDEKADVSAILNRFGV